MFDNVRIIYKDLPCTIGAFVVLRDDFYTIVVNARSSHDQQEQSIAHELEHIMHGDFDHVVDVDELEARRHESSKNVFREVAVPPG